MIYLLIEDAGSGKKFWEFLCEVLYKGTDIRVLSMENAPRLVAKVKQITDTSNFYLILHDCPYDNKISVNEHMEMSAYIRETGNKNMFLLDLISFEFILLSFQELYTWIGYQADMEKKEIIVLAAKTFVQAVENGIFAYKDLDIIKQYISDYGSKKKVYSMESLSASLLRNLTAYTNFAIGKSGKPGMTFDRCWVSDCCCFPAYEKLCRVNLSSVQKAELYVTQTCLAHSFENILLKIMQ